MASVFAATYPERTSGLILWGTQATWIRTADYPWGVTMEEALAEIDDLAEHGMTDTYLSDPGLASGPSACPKKRWSGSAGGGALRRPRELWRISNG